MTAALLITLGLLLTTIGIVCLFGSWRRLPLFNGRYGVVAGWLLLLLAVPFWNLALGVEFGISYALLMSGLLALIVALLNRELRQGRQRPAANAALQLPAGATLGRHVVLFLIAVPLAGLVTALSLTTAMLMLPMHTGNALVVILLLLPLAWGGVSCWVLADPRLYRPLLTLLALMVVSTLMLYL